MDTIIYSAVVKYRVHHVRGENERSEKMVTCYYGCICCPSIYHYQPLILGNIEMGGKKLYTHLFLISHNLGFRETHVTNYYFIQLFTMYKLNSCKLY